MQSATAAGRTTGGSCSAPSMPRSATFIWRKTRRRGRPAFRMEPQIVYQVPGRNPTPHTDGGSDAAPDPQMSKWRPLVPVLRDLRAQGLTCAQIGERLGVSRAAVAKAVWTHVLGNGHGSGTHEREWKGSRHYRSTDDSSFIETWTDRKARLAKERAK